MSALKTKHIEVIPYNLEWPDLFEKDVQSRRKIQSGLVKFYKQNAKQLTVISKRNG